VNCGGITVTSRELQAEEGLRAPYVEESYEFNTPDRSYELP
jgi:hypothetical protein